MTTQKGNSKAGPAEEQLFIAKALEAAEKAEKLSRIKRIVFSGLALLVAVWLAIRAPGPQFGANALLMILLVAVVASTQKVVALNNKNTSVTPGYCTGRPPTSIRPLTLFVSQVATRPSPVIYWAT